MNAYARKKILVLGGTGFIGTNLVHAIFRSGAEVTVVSRGKIRPAIELPKEIKLITLDISTLNPSSLLLLHGLIEKSDMVFDLAGRSGAVSSTQGPYSDLQNNVFGQYNLLETCRIANPNVRVVFLSSRLVYGRAEQLPVAEEHPTKPTSFYGINKLMAEKYHQLFWSIHKVKTTVLRVTIPYGPNNPAKVYQHGIINLFLEKAAKNETILIYGDGHQLRDIIYVDDLVEAIMKTAVSDKAIGHLYNLGYGEGISLSDIAINVCDVMAQGSIEYIDWPEDALKVETGDFYCSNKKLSKDIDWRPQTSLRDGILKSAAYYQSKYS